MILMIIELLIYVGFQILHADKEGLNVNTILVNTKEYVHRKMVKNTQHVLQLKVRKYT